ncbi:MAG TPA: P-II family nitrogen regulator [Nitrososphaera sp.]|nr:P-II family nitrogen regulator [Nitrososphaera sp.]
MKKIEAIVRTEKLPIVKEKLRAIGIGGMTISNVSGWSKQRELHLQWRGQPMAYDLLPKIKFEIVVPDSQEDLVVKSIVESARTGEHGDGVIFVTTIDIAINISTMEKGEKAILQPDHKEPETKSAGKGK